VRHPWVDIQRWNIPIHVDAASGGFIAPFLYPDIEWDFRLPLVKSINVSGHKYGLVYAGIGWVVWRNKEDLPEELVFHVNYLGADQPTFTLNFSKGASQVIAQYYQLIRLGFEGYKNIMSNCAHNAKTLTTAIRGIGRFKVLSKEIGVPVVAFSLLDNSQHDEYEISDNLRRYGWTVPAYTMAPNAESVTLLRVVVREDFSRSLADRLVTDIKRVLEYLDKQPPKLTRIVTAALQEEASKDSPLPKTPSQVKLTDAFRDAVTLQQSALKESALHKKRNHKKKHALPKTNGVC
jgi:glutamate decarboxylase